MNRDEDDGGHMAVTWVGRRRAHPGSRRREVGKGNEQRKGLGAAQNVIEAWLERSGGSGMAKTPRSGCRSSCLLRVRSAPAREGPAAGPHERLGHRGKTGAVARASTRLSGL